MKNGFKSVIKLISVIVFACFMLTACHKVTQDNFAKIKSGMTYAEVTAILGKPDSTSSIAIGDLSGTSATWKGGKKTITIQFANDKVMMKNLSQD